MNVLSLPCDFSLTYYSVIMQCILHETYKIFVNQLLILSVRLSVKRKLLEVKFWERLQLYLDFLWCKSLHA